MGTKDILLWGLPCDGLASRPGESSKLLGMLHVKETGISPAVWAFGSCASLPFPELVLLGILGGAVPPGFPNPEPISDQTEMLFFTPVFRPGFNFHSDFQTRDRQKLVIIYLE